MADLVDQTAGYIAGRTPPPSPKKQGGGGMGNLNPMQFAKKIPGMGGMGGGAAGEAGATGGGVMAVAEEAAPLLLL